MLNKSRLLTWLNLSGGAKVCVSQMGKNDLAQIITSSATVEFFVFVRKKIEYSFVHQKKNSFLQKTSAQKWHERGKYNKKYSFSQLCATKSCA